MRLRPRRTLGLAAAFAVTSALVAGAAPVTASAANPALRVDRVYGADRIGTAVAASKSFTGGQAKAVVLARSDDYADSLGAAPLASDVGGPLLLTGSAGLDGAVAAAIQDVLVQGGKVYLLGGERALSANVATQVRALSKVGSVQRVAGADRFATAVEIAKLLPQAQTVALVTGWNFPDGLSAGALMGVVEESSGHSIGVVLLSEGRSTGATTANYLAGRSFTTKIAIGGDAATAASATSTGWARLVGADRYATSALVAAQFTSDAFFEDTTGIVGVATGQNWADALAGSALLAYGGGPLLLSAPDTVPDSTRKALVDLQADAVKSGKNVQQALVFGGPGVIKDPVLDQVRSALQ
jgi:putative cell wall-binding protein